MPNEIEQLVQDWERAKLGIEAYLDAMPEDKYGFRPVPDVLSFAGHFLHIAHANYMFAAGFGAVSPLKDEAADKNPDLQSKTSVREYTLASYDFLLNAIKALDPASLGEEVPLFRWTMPRRVVLAKALEHQVHHSGQAVVYIRLQGIKPPNERLF